MMIRDHEEIAALPERRLSGVGMASSAPLLIEGRPAWQGQQPFAPALVRAHQQTGSMAAEREK